MTLRRELNAEQLSRYLAADDLRNVMDANSPANRILLIMGSGWPCGGETGSFQTFCSIA
jgi:putative membrane protein